MTMNPNAAVAMLFDTVARQFRNDLDDPEFWEEAGTTLDDLAKAIRTHGAAIQLKITMAKAFDENGAPIHELGLPLITNGPQFMGNTVIEPGVIR
jgi:hypothetical protein